MIAAEMRTWYFKESSLDYPVPTTARAYADLQSSDRNGAGEDGA